MKEFKREDYVYLKFIKKKCLIKIFSKKMKYISHDTP